MLKMKSLTAGFLILVVFPFVAFSELSNQSKFIPDTSNEFKPQVLADSFTDGKAIISNVTGTVKILRSDTDEWLPAGENDALQEGDQIRTDSDASVDIVYDDSSLNVTHIRKNTIAKFISLEPTRIYLSDGSVFNLLDGLPKGSAYEVSTPTAVAAIRGTRFVSDFNGQTKLETTSVMTGDVHFFPFLGEQNHIEADKFYSIKADKGLDFEPQTGEFKALEPHALTQEQKNFIQSHFDSSRDNLKNYGGGAAVLEEAMGKWNTLKKDAAKTMAHPLGDGRRNRITHSSGRRVVSFGCLHYHLYSFGTDTRNLLFFDNGLL